MKGQYGEPFEFAMDRLWSESLGEIHLFVEHDGEQEIDHVVRERAGKCMNALDGLNPEVVGDVVEAARKSLDTVNELIGCHQARLQSMLRKTEELPVGAAYRAEVLKSNANVIKGLKEEIVMLEARREQTKTTLAKLVAE